MSVKQEIKGSMLNVVSVYAPQVGCQVEEKEEFSSKLNAAVERFLRNERWEQISMDMQVKETGVMTRCWIVWC